MVEEIILHLSCRNRWENNQKGTIVHGKLLGSWGSVKLHPGALPTVSALPEQMGRCKIMMVKDRMTLLCQPYFPHKVS